MDDAATLPSFFEPLLAQCYDADDVRRIVEGCAVQRAVTLRANTLKASSQQVASQLGEAGVQWKGVSWYDDAFVIEGVREDRIRELPLYDQGGVYLQSLSSMIPALVLDAQPGEDIADLCAAPGGKTTQIAALTGGKAYITACEMHEPRAQKLQHNLEKQGARNVTVMRVDARRLDDFFSFDRILVDAPCSGSGTLRAGDAKMFKRFTPQLIKKSQKAQQALLSKALMLVRPGGTVVYSTCSVLRDENERIVEEALAHVPRSRSFELKPVVVGSAADGSARIPQEMPVLPSALEGALTVCPTELYEGFFVAKLHRIA